MIHFGRCLCTRAEVRPGKVVKHPLSMTLHWVWMVGGKQEVLEAVLLDGDFSQSGENVAPACEDRLSILECVSGQARWVCRGCVAGNDVESIRHADGEALAVFHV